MSDRQPYSRVYWSIRRDPKFRGIYSDDHHLAAWLRLLIAADATWPAPADIPANARRGSIAALADCGLIDLLDDGLFTVHGLDAERGRRREAATRGASAPQAGPKREASGTQTVPTRAGEAETRRDELSRDELDARPPDAFDAFYSRTGSVPGAKMKSWLNDLSERHGERAVVAKIAETAMDNRQPPGYLQAVSDALALDDHRAEKAEQADEKRRNEEKRRPIKILPTPESITPEEAERIAREYMAEAKAAQQ